MKIWEIVLVTILLIVAIGLAVASVYALAVPPASSQYGTSAGAAGFLGGYRGGMMRGGMMGGYSTNVGSSNFGGSYQQGGYGCGFGGCLMR